MNQTQTLEQKVELTESQTKTGTENLYEGKTLKERSQLNRKLSYTEARNYREAGSYSTRNY